MASLSPAVPWAVACDARCDITTVQLAKWPTHLMTREELRILARANDRLDEARNEIRRLQASLSERSKGAGDDQPDYDTARSL